MILLITLVLGVVNIVPIVREKREKEGSEKGKSSCAVSRKADGRCRRRAGARHSRRNGAASSLSQQHKSAAAVEKYGSNVLKLYLPGEYLGENVISDFEKQFGVRVIVENFDSNEMMYTKLMAGDTLRRGHSLGLHDRTPDEGGLSSSRSIKSLIPNLENMDDAVRGMSYDPDNDVVRPLLLGQRRHRLQPRERRSLPWWRNEGWEVLRNTDYAGHLYIYDSERDSFMMAFKALGYSMNTSDPDEINAAYEWLLQMNDTMSPVYVTDEVIDGMMNGYKDHRGRLLRRRHRHSRRERGHELLYAGAGHEHLVRRDGHSRRTRRIPCSPTSSSTICSPMRPHLTIRRRWGILLPTQRSLRR